MRITHHFRHLFSVSVVAFILPGCSICRSFTHWLLSDNTPTVTNEAVPSHPISWQQFVNAHKGRKFSMAELRKRFDVADANNDGLLTPEEIQSHQEAAEENKQQRG